MYSFSFEQTQYILARAIYEEAWERYKELTKNIPKDWETDEELDKIIEMEMAAEEEVGLNAATEALRKAEDQLIQWAYEMMQKNLSPEQLKQIEPLFTSKMARLLPNIREKLIDLCMGIQP